MPPKALIDLSRIDPNKVVADIEAIRKHNPQRYEFEQLSHICHFDTEAEELAGVLDVDDADVLTVLVDQTDGGVGDLFVDARPLPGRRRGDDVSDYVSFSSIRGRE